MLPPGMPADPKAHYTATGEWKGWRDFLGNENICDECGDKPCECPSTKKVIDGWAAQESELANKIVSAVGEGHSVLDVATAMVDALNEIFYDVSLPTGGAFSAMSEDSNGRSILVVMHDQKFFLDFPKLLKRLGRIGK